MAAQEIVSEFERLLINYDKAIDEGYGTLVTVATVLFDGVPLIDKFNALSNTKKKKFNPDQLNHIQNGDPLIYLDISLLDLVIKLCGGLSTGPLPGLIQQLKDSRNIWMHEKRKMHMDKAKLIAEVSRLRKLYTDMLEELKIGPNYNTARIPSFDDDITEMRARMVKLETIWDGSEVLTYAQSEIDKCTKETCKIQTAERYEGCHTVMENEEDGVQRQYEIILHERPLDFISDSPFASVSASLFNHWGLTFSFEGVNIYSFEAFRFDNKLEPKWYPGDIDPKCSSNWSEKGKYTTKRTCSINEVIAKSEKLGGGRYSIQRNNCQTFAIDLAAHFGAEISYASSEILNSKFRDRANDNV